MLPRRATAVVQNAKASRSRFLMVILRKGEKKERQTNGFILSFSPTVLSFQTPSLWLVPDPLSSLIET